MTTISHTERSVPAEWAFNGESLIVPAAPTGRRTRLAVTWHAVMNYLVPIGYEDEAGFHYGEMPPSNTSIRLGEKAA